MHKLLSTVLRWLRLLTTTRDNQTPDVIRIGSILLGAQFIINSAWALFGLSQTWDPNAYGLGAASILAATGLALWGKRKDEPDA